MEKIDLLMFLSYFDFSWLDEHDYLPGAWAPWWKWLQSLLLYIFLFSLGLHLCSIGHPSLKLSLNKRHKFHDYLGKMGENDLQNGHRPEKRHLKKELSKF